MLKDKIDPVKIGNLMAFLEKKSLIYLITKDISVSASELSVQHNLAAADALIYATSQQIGTELVTRDNDFRGLPRAIVLS